MSKAVRTLAEQALAQTQLIGADVVQSITAMIAEIDKKLSEQINQIMHHPDFQKLEGSWRGLHYLVNNTETDEMLKIRVHQHQQGGPRQDAQALQGHGLGPEPDLQDASTSRNTASSAASPSAAWSVTTTSTTPRLTSSCSVR